MDPSWPALEVGLLLDAGDHPVPVTVFLAGGRIVMVVYHLGQTPSEAWLQNAAELLLPPPGAIADELGVTEIPLTGPGAARNAEISGMAWFADTLILLPQYPLRIASGYQGALLALPAEAINAYLDGELEGPLEPLHIPLGAPGIREAIDGFEGFEAIAFSGNRAFLTVEASPPGGTRAYVVAGLLDPDLRGLTLDLSTLVEIESQAGIGDLSDETIVVDGDRLLVIHEANGAAVNPSPMAHVFDLDLRPLGTVPLPNVEYRLTDATAPDAAGRFWAANVFYPGDAVLLPESEPFAALYGRGPTHDQHDHVERLLQFQLYPDRIGFGPAPPLQLELLPDGNRNWEGIVRLDGRGFLLVTDKFPTTILAFVPWP